VSFAPSWWIFSEINCVASQDGHRLGDSPVSAIHSYVQRPECFVWVALKDPAPAELQAMQREFGLHDLAVEDAQHGHQRPKIEEYGQSLFVVLHMIEPNYVLSVRSQAERGFIDVRARCEKEPELLKHGSGYVLYALMDAVVDRYFPVLDAIETELEGVEQGILRSMGSSKNS
jgi:magnesium transporter